MTPYSGFIDFHSHILPRVDHGSDTLETSLYQLACAKKAGVNKIVSTSHFYPTAHNVESFLSKRNEAFDLLKKNIGNEFEIRLGAEVLVCARIDHLPVLEKLFIEGTNTLLLELPFSSYCSDYTLAIKRLVGCGVDVVIAHADRYDRSIIDGLLSYGVKLQINASSLVGFAKYRNKHLFDWLDKEYVVALGSDIHGKDSYAYRRLVKAYKNIGAYASYVLSESEQRFRSYAASVG